MKRQAVLFPIKGQSAPFFFRTQPAPGICRMSGITVDRQTVLVAPPGARSQGRNTRFESFSPELISGEMNRRRSARHFTSQLGSCNGRTAALVAEESWILT